MRTILYIHKEGSRDGSYPTVKLKWMLSINNSLKKYVHSYDSRAVPELLVKYQVSRFPTAILLDKEREIERAVGSENVADALLDYLNNCQNNDSND